MNNDKVWVKGKTKKGALRFIHLDIDFLSASVKSKMEMYEYDLKRRMILLKKYIGRLLLNCKEEYFIERGEEAIVSLHRGRTALTN